MKSTRRFDRIMSDVGRPSSARTTVLPRAGLLLLAAICAAGLHCGGGDDAAGGGPAGGGGGPGADGGGPGADGGGPGADGGGPVTSCDAFGRYGVPSSTFTLPATGDSIYYEDIQAKFPNVDWMKLERLYVPAGKYKTFLIGNLPVRTAASPLVITNLGGQVEVGPNIGGNFIWSINGGANWVLTGRYDPDSKTGDPGFVGHRCGAYAASAGKYGFVSDDAFDLTAPYVHMGLAVGGGATDFELEYIEVKRSGFAGIRLLNSGGPTGSDPDKPMNNVRVHDTYVHDTDGEGFYFGWTGEPPSSLFANLQIYNNRIVRTGTEALQIQDVGEGSHIHHNVIAFGGLHWLDAFGEYQDGCIQMLAREGKIEFDHNVAMGGAGTFLNFFSSPQGADGARNVTFHDNYFADTRSLGGYLNGASTAGSSFTFAHNFFRGLDFSYTTVDPAATDPGVVFGIGNTHKAPITFDANTFEGGRKLVSAIPLNGTSANVTATNNVNGPVAPIAYVASGYPDVPTSKLTMWGRTATLAPGQPPITYAIGDLVMSDAELYRAKTASSNLVPSEHPEAWEKLPRPIDDLRVAPTSPYAAMGVR
jgi:hypothetical protein